MERGRGRRSRRWGGTKTDRQTERDSERDTEKKSPQVFTTGVIAVI